METKLNPMQIAKHLQQVDRQIRELQGKKKISIETGLNILENMKHRVEWESEKWNFSHCEEIEKLITTLANMFKRQAKDKGFQ